MVLKSHKMLIGSKNRQISKHKIYLKIQLSESVLLLLIFHQQAKFYKATLLLLEYRICFEILDKYRLKQLHFYY